MGLMKAPNCFLREQHLKKKAQNKQKSEHDGSISNTSEMDRDNFFQSTLEDNFFWSQCQKDAVVCRN